MENSLKIYLIGALIFSASLFVWAFLNPNAGIDIQEHDTYYVFSIASFCNGLGVLLLLKAVIVFLIKDQAGENRLLGYHVLIELGLIVFVLCVRYYYYGYHYNAIPRRYYRFNGSQQFVDVSTSYLIPFVIVVVVVYLLNQLFFIGIIGFNYIKRKNKLE